MDYAPDIDDLYKDCVWVINDSHVNVPVVCQFAAQLDCRCGLLCVLIQRINRFVALDNRVGDRLIHHHRLVGRLFKHGNIGVVCLCSVLKHIVDAYRIILLRVTDDHGDGCAGNQQNGSQQNKSSYYYEESIADSPHKINIPEYPVEALRRYYTFEGWYRSPLYVQKVDFDTYKMPDNDETFYAKWVPTKENVIFYNDYAAFENDKQLHNTTVPYNSLMLTEDIPTTQGQGHYKLTLPFSGARFSGWYYIDDTGTAVRFEPQILPVTRDLKLFAQWTSDLTAKYKVEYVEKGTDTPVADPLIGEAPVSSTKTFKAKANGDLNEAHRWKEGENNWWPVIQSHSLLIKPDESDNYYRFEYTQKGDVWYTVRYLDAATGDSLHDPVQKCSHNLLVTEQYLPIPHYLPNFTVKSQVIAASTKENSDDAKAEELQTNVITFLYSKNDEQAYYQVDHKVLKNGGDPEKKDDYEQYRTESFVTEINHVLDFDTEVYGTPISSSLQNSGYHVVKKLTNVNGTQYNDTAELKVDGNNMVITVYYERQKYPYKVLYVDRNQESDYINGISDDKGILETHIFKDENQMQPVGAEVEINAPETLTVGEDHYTRVSQEKPVLTIRHEVYDHENPDPKLNVIKVYYEKERSVTLFYKVICDGAVEGDLVLSQNQEVIRKKDTAKGSTAMDESGVSGRYTFLGWFRTPAATDENNNRLTTADESFFKPDPVPANNTTYYALFKMNTVPYTLNYVYQGRRGGNNGNNYSGDDAEYLVDYAPDIDDLYKDCVWVINDSHVTVDDANHTVTITAVQKPKLCTVEFFLNNSTLLKIERVSLNSWVTQEDGKFVEAPEKDGDNPFAYWSVKEKSTGKEISRCFDRAFDLRVTGDITVTACYSAEAQRIFIGNPSYSREQTTDAGGKVTDKLYADFILAYMEKNGKLLNPNYDNRVSDEYKTGVIVEYDQNKMLTKPDAAGATLSDDDKKEVVYESNDVLNKEDAKKLVNNEAVSLNHRYFCFAVANDKYNNHNRVDRVITFINSPTARHLVLRAYYYVWNVTTGEFEMTEPVYFYLYDIGNSVSEANSQ